MARRMLHWAAEFGRVSAAEVLLERPDVRPNPRPGNDTSRTALYLATINGHPRNRPPPSPATRYKTKPEILGPNAPPRSHILRPHVHSPITTRAQGR